MTHLVIDGMNVIGSRPDGWWHDRNGAVHRLLDRLRRLAPDCVATITLVLDGRPTADIPEGTYDDVQVVYARRAGRGSGDDRIVEFVSGLDDPTTSCVVTSDRALRERVRALGAAVTGASTFLDDLDARSNPSG